MDKAENLKIPPLVVPAAQQSAAGVADENTEMQTASPSAAIATATATGTGTVRRSPLHGRHYPSLHNNLYIPHQASVPDPTLFSFSSQPEDKSSDVEKRDILRRKHHKHHKSRHERDEKHARTQSFPIEHVTEMPFQLGKKRARAAAAEAEEKARAREREREEEARRLREAKEAREELAGRFPFVKKEEVLKKADLEELREKRLKEEQYVYIWSMVLQFTNIYMSRANSDALGDITDQSASFSQRLDKACYNLLDNAADIRTSIRSVQVITNRTVERHRDFDVRSSAMLREAKAQIMKFDNFSRQIKGIDALEARIIAARKEAAVLDKRLETARGRIMAWDREEDEWQAKITRRLRMLAAAVILMFVAWVGMKIMGWWHPEPVFDIFRSKTTAVAAVPGGADAEVCSQGVSPDWSCLKSSPGTEAAVEIATKAVDHTASRSTTIEAAGLEEPLQRIIDEL
ncbi:uncharacterized protein GIQ15_04681 [Arthroderma uncinatum]|uniref:uncharacterized protein n=1 Tax=Arthroderma uncinatum TaxID=74035 RepID=UPI00144A7B66|nr:uncharacterized protein GIQ15_04681 [Arthroderma uncinatum]KAF3481922.1 hypothetical protein GIQ15_04681 [Arthroderma uncinatum]